MVMLSPKLMIRILRGFVCWNRDVSKIHSLYLASVQKGGEEHGPEDNGFVSYAKAVIDEDPVLERFVRLVVKVTFAGDIIRNDADKGGTSTGCQSMLMLSSDIACPRISRMTIFVF